MNELNVTPIPQMTKLFRHTYTGSTAEMGVLIILIFYLSEMKYFNKVFDF